MGATNAAYATKDAHGTANGAAARSPAATSRGGGGGGVFFDTEKDESEGSLIKAYDRVLLVWARFDLL